jgi:hypothetical protein
VQAPDEAGLSGGTAEFDRVANFLTIANSSGQCPI